MENRVIYGVFVVIYGGPIVIYVSSMGFFAVFAFFLAATLPRGASEKLVLYLYLCANRPLFFIKILKAAKVFRIGRGRCIF
jgi:hypothetical protein